MNFSIVNVTKQIGNYIEGTWTQGAIATTLEDATQRAIAYEIAGKNETEYAVVPEMSVCQHDFLGKRLDKSRFQTHEEITLGEYFQRSMTGENNCKRLFHG